MSQIIFIILLGVGVGYFTMNIRKTIRNIKLGKDVNRTDQKNKRWRNMTLKALGQKKMFKRPVPAMLHLFAYLGLSL